MSMIKETLDYLEEANGLRDNIYEKIGELTLLIDDAERSAELFGFAKTSAEEFKQSIIGLGLNYDPSVFGSYDELVENLLNNGSNVRNEMYEISAIISELDQKFS